MLEGANENESWGQSIGRFALGALLAGCVLLWVAGPLQKAEGRTQKAAIAGCVGTDASQHTDASQCVSTTDYVAPLAPLAVPTDPPSLTATNTATETPGGPTRTPTRTNTRTPTPVANCWQSWQISWSPNAGLSDNMLWGAAAVSPSDIWAVGSYSSTVGYRTLTEHWDGRKWNVVPSPNVNLNNNRLFAVVALSSNDVWAVGTYTIPGESSHMLTMRWDGTAWSFSPNSSYGLLRGMAAFAPDDVWAVGDSSSLSSVAGIGDQGSGIGAAGRPDPRSLRPEGAYDTIALHWDGAGWSTVSTPQLGTPNNTLAAIAGVAPDDVWAVGYSGVDALIEHWDGTEWTYVPSPDPSGDGWSTLNGVAALAPDDVWAVGSVAASTGSVPLIEHWDGTEWSIVPQTNLRITGSLDKIRAVSPNDIWAVGVKYPDGSPTGTGRTLIEHWNGLTWQEVAGQNVGQDSNVLIDLAPASDREVWAVGFHGPTFDRRNLVERYSGTFTDVQPSDYFYQSVQYLSCRDAISGYSDGAFRPYNNTTRAQACKILALAEDWPAYIPGVPTFRDVPATHPFYSFVETAYRQGIISGYNCGTGCLEFKPGNNVTRAQMCKLTALAEGWPAYAPSTPTFQDVPAAHPFYGFIETAYHQGIIAGYTCGARSESSERGDACLEFRPGNNATRGQISKMIYSAVSQP